MGNQHLWCLEDGNCEESKDTNVTRSSQGWVKHKEEEASVKDEFSLLGSPTLPQHPRTGAALQGNILLMHLAHAATHQEETLLSSWVPMEGMKVITLAGTPAGTHALHPQLSSSREVCSCLSVAPVPIQNTHPFPPTCPTRISSEQTVPPFPLLCFTPFPPLVFPFCLPGVPFSPLSPSLCPYSQSSPC